MSSVKVSAPSLVKLLISMVISRCDTLFSIVLLYIKDDFIPYITQNFWEAADISIAYISE